MIVRFLNSSLRIRLVPLLMRGSGVPVALLGILLLVTSVAAGDGLIGAAAEGHELLVAAVSVIRAATAPL